MKKYSMNLLKSVKKPLKAGYSYNLIGVTIICGKRRAFWVIELKHLTKIEAKNNYYL